MSVADDYVPLKELGNGSTVDFSDDWNPLSVSNLVVYLENVTTGAQTLQAYTTDYTAVCSDSGFTVTFVTAPTSSYYVVIGMNIPYTQTSPYTTVKGWQGSVVENSFDKLTRLTQQLKETLSRALVFALGSTGATLPSATDCAGKYLAFDATTGAPIALNGVASISTSTTSLLIGTGTKAFTLADDALFISGQSVIAVSAADPTDYMFGTVASYAADILTVTVTAFGGSGTHSDWNIGISGPQGIQGATGASGSGTGDMLAANNLSEVTASTARSNLGLGSAATLDSIDEDDMASDSATKLPTQQSVKAYVDSKTTGVISGHYASSAQTITSAATITLTHSLGAMPLFCTAELVCQSTDAGYTAADHIEVPINSGGGYNEQACGVSCIKTTTELILRYTNRTYVWCLPHATTGAPTGLTNAKWKVIIHAFV